MNARANTAWSVAVVWGLVVVLVGVVVFLDSKEPDRTKQRRELVILVSTQYKCSKVKVMEFHAPRGTSHWWAQLKVCGVVRFYERNRWDGNRYASWRERERASER